MTYTGSSWVLVGSAGFTDGLSFSKMALHPITHAPYVVSSTGNQAGNLTVMRFNSGAWETVGPANFSSKTCGDLSLAMHPTTGVPYVAYSNCSHNNYTITVKTFDGSVWSTVGLPDFSSSAAYVNLAVSPTTGALYAAYEDYTSYKASVMTYSFGPPTPKP